MPSTYMLDTNICSFIMRERPIFVLERLHERIGGLRFEDGSVELLDKRQLRQKKEACVNLPYQAPNQF